MNEIIELALESADGTIDCQLEPQGEEPGSTYTATILYPGTANGYNRSDIFCYTLKRDADTGGYFFEYADDMHPKIKRLEAQLSAAIVKAGGS